MNKYLVKIAEKQEPVGPGRALVNVTTRALAEGAALGVGGALLGGGVGAGAVALKGLRRGIPMNRLGKVFADNAERAAEVGGSMGRIMGSVHGSYASIRNSLDSQKGQ